jgi:hypothetical protein
MSVILNEVKNLVESMGWKTEILRLMPQNDITTQSLTGEGAGGGEQKNVIADLRRSFFFQQRSKEPPILF